MDKLNNQAKREAKKKIDLLIGHSFKIICKALINLLDNVKINTHIIFTHIYIN